MSSSICRTPKKSSMGCVPRQLAKEIHARKLKQGSEQRRKIIIIFPFVYKLLQKGSLACLSPPPPELLKYYGEAFTKIHDYACVLIAFKALSLSIYSPLLRVKRS